MERGPVTAGVLLELVNLISLSPADNPQARSYENRKCEMYAQDVVRLLPVVTYSVFSEVVGKLDQNSDTLEAYLARQISTLYFLLRLAPLYKANNRDPVVRRWAMLSNEPSHDPRPLFPDGILEGGVINCGNQLLLNYLTESWNRYTYYGGVRSEREAVAHSRLYCLVKEVENTYGWWVWPFFHHFESSEHVDRMTAIVEASNGTTPYPQEQRTDATEHPKP